MRIEKLNQLQLKQWDQLVAERKWSVHCLAGWHDVLKKNYKADLKIWAAYDDADNATGYLMGYLHRSVFYSPYFGFFANDENTKEALLTRLREYCVRHKALSYIITSGTGNSFFSEGGLFEKRNLFLPLRYNEEQDMWAFVPKKTRNMIRKAEKENFSFSAEWQFIKDFHNIYQSRMGFKKLRTKALDYFQSLKETFGDRLTLFTLGKDGQIVAGMIFLEGSDHAGYLYNASTDAALRSGGNNFLMWEAMKYYRGRGLDFIELGESSPEGAVYSFKKRLSQDVQVVPVYYCRHTVSAGPLSKRIALFLRNKTNGLLNRANVFLPEQIKLPLFEGHGRLI